MLFERSFIFFLAEATARAYRCYKYGKVTIEIPVWIIVTQQRKANVPLCAAHAKIGLSAKHSGVPDIRSVDVRKHVDDDENRYHMHVDHALPLSLGSGRKLTVSFLRSS